MPLPGKNILLTGSGTYLPGKPIPFSQVDHYLGELNDIPEKLKTWLGRMRGLMEQMLDIEYYHFAIDPETRQFTEDNITMSVKAARIAMETADIPPEEIDFIAYGSAHQHQMPTASVRIQDALGIEQCAEMSIHANCTSAYKALMVAHEFLQSGRYKTALVLSSSMSSSELRAEYLNQPIAKKEELFLRYFLSDGAGALVLKATDKNEPGLYLTNTYTESIGGKKPAAMRNLRPAYWMNPKEEFKLGYHHLAQLFNEQLREHFNEPDGSVFYKGLKRMIEKYSIDLDKIHYFQVNFPSKHISEIVMDECEMLGIPRQTWYSKMATMGYVGPPMAFICLDHILRNELLNNGDLILSFVTEVSKFMQAGFTFQYRS